MRNNRKSSSSSSSGSGSNSGGRSRGRNMDERAPQPRRGGSERSEFGQPPARPAGRLGRGPARGSSQDAPPSDRRGRGPVRASNQEGHPDTRRGTGENLGRSRFATPAMGHSGRTTRPPQRPVAPAVPAMREVSVPEAPSLDFIYGRHAVQAALENEDTAINKVWIQDTLREDLIGKRLESLARNRRVPVVTASRQKMEELLQATGAVHQGVIASLAPQAYKEVADLVEIAAKANDRAPFILLLDGIEDPHNLGAIIRSAEAAGVHGVVIPQHRAVPLTGAVAKAAAGAASRVPVARAVNLTQALEYLKKEGYWIVGLEADGKELYTQANLKGPLALVLGGEDRGVSRLVREHCDFVVHIPMAAGGVSSLNASVAGALVMFEVVRQRS